MTDSSTDEWPHDPKGKLGSDGMRNFDMAVLSKMVGKDEFPLRKSDFLEEYGDWPVQINYERVVSVAEIFEAVKPARFESKEEFHRAVGDAMRTLSLWEYHPGS